MSLWVIAADALRLKLSDYVIRVLGQVYQGLLTIALYSMLIRIRFNRIQESSLSKERTLISSGAGHHTSSLTQAKAAIHILHY